MIYYTCPDVNSCRICNHGRFFFFKFFDRGSHYLRTSSIKNLCISLLAGFYFKVLKNRTDYIFCNEAGQNSL